MGGVNPLPNTVSPSSLLWDNLPSCLLSVLSNLLFPVAKAYTVYLMESAVDSYCLIPEDVSCSAVDLADALEGEGRGGLLQQQRRTIDGRSLMMMIMMEWVIDGKVI